MLLDRVGHLLKPPADEQRQPGSQKSRLLERTLSAPDTHQVLAQKLELVRPQPPEPGGAGRVSFEQVYDQHFSFSWRVLRHLGLRGHALDDAAQEVWLIVHRRLEDFEARSDVHTWLFGIAFNVARNHRRGLARRGRGELLSTELMTSEPDPEAVHSARETWTSLQRFLDTLTESDRGIFTCNLIERLSAAETASAVGVDVAIVYQRVRVLRRMVKQWLDQ